MLHTAREHYSDDEPAFSFVRRRSWLEEERRTALRDLCAFHSRNAARQPKRTGLDF